MPVKRKGVIFIVSAPSGAGKTTLVKRLMKLIPDIRLSVSCTTRRTRPGEIPGQDYHFVGERKFELMRDRGDFAEWANVHGSFYGTPDGAETINMTPLRLTGILLAFITLCFVPVP